MTSMPLAPSLVIGSVRWLHPVDNGACALVKDERPQPRLKIPHLIKHDDIAILAVAELGQTHLAGADAFDAGDARDGVFGRPVVNNVFNKIHDNASPRHSLGGSKLYLRFSSGLCHFVTFLSRVNRERLSPELFSSIGRISDTTSYNPTWGGGSA